MRRRFLLSLLMLVSVLLIPPASYAVPPAADLNAMFTAYGNQGGHWTGGDSTVSVRLPDGRTAWFFSDTFLGTVNADFSRPKTAPFIRNSAVVQQGDQLVQTLHGGTAQNPTTLVTGANPDEFHWIGAAMVQGNAVKALYGRYKNAGSGPLGFQRVGTTLVTFSLPALTVASVTDLSLQNKIGWGSAILSDGGYDYVYGTEDADGFKFAHVARVPSGNLGAAWQFWDGTAWGSDETRSKRLFSGGGTGFSVIRKDGQIVVVTHDGNVGFSPWFVAYTASAPTGPFAGPTYLHKAPEPGLNPWQFAYDAQLHQEQAATGTLLMSYNVNSLQNEDNYKDARIYRPRFVDVTWPRPIPGPGVPAAPSNVNLALGTDGGGTVTWNAPDGLSFWLYQRDVTAGQTHFSHGPSSVTIKSQQLGGLKDGHTYEFKVSAVNGVGEGAFSATVSGTAHVIPPNAPTNLRATPGVNVDVALAWDAVQGSNVLYAVQKRDVTAGDTDFTDVWFPSPANTTHTVTDLLHNHAYEFRVIARNGGGESPPSNVVAATAVSAPPLVPTGLTAVAQSDGSAKLSWNSAGEGLWYWIYQRDVTAGAAFQRLEYPVTNGTSAQPGLLTNGHVYEFAISSVNRFNLESAKSPVASVTARWDKPAAPANLTATAQSDGGVKLTWSSTGENHWYWIHQRDVTAGETAFTKLDYPVTDGTTFTAGLLLKDHVYAFKVSAINAGGDGPLSAEVQATARYDAPAAPTNLTATPGDGTVALNWTASAPGAWYWIYQRDVTAGDTNFTKLEYPITDGTSFTAGLLANGHTYEFKVSAITAGGEGAASAPVSGKPMPPLPAKVTGLSATQQASGEIKLSWSAQPSVYYWIYQRDATAGQQFSKLPFPASDASFTAGGLTHGHVYEFRIAATNLAGDGPASDVVSAKSQFAVPGAPANLRGSAAGDGSIDLAWDSAGPNLFYWVYRRDVTAGEAGFTRAAFPTDKTLLSWEQLQNGHVYEFYVRAENAGGLGAASNTVSIKSLGGLPQPPSGLTASPGNGRVVISWTASSTPDVLYWVYYRDASLGENFRKLEVPFGSPAATLEPLTNGHTYEFKVAATNWAGDSRTTPVVSARPLPPVPAAASLTAIAGNGEVGLGWNAVDQATYFWVEYRDITAGQGSFQRLPLPVSNWALTVRPLANGHQYEFRVISGNVAGESGPSNVVRATPVPPPPAAPSNLRAVAGNGKVSLSWNASPSGPVYYWVYFRPQGHRDWYYFQYPASGTSFVATGLLNNFTYEFKVTAANLGGQSAPSNVVSARPFLPLPAAPPNLRVTAGDGQATLTWDPSPSGPVFYWVYFKPQGQNDWFYYQFPASGTSFVAQNLLNGFNYSFRVTAANQAGQSPPSNEVTVKPMPPLPAKPTGLRAPAYAYNSRIPLYWDSNPVPGVSYSVEVRNASHQGVWYPWESTRQTSSVFDPSTYGIVWEFRVIARNMTGSSEPSDVARQVSLPWLPYGSPPSYGFNGGNGANAAAVPVAMSLECDDSFRQKICFGWSVGGNQPSTIGDYFFYPGSREDLNRWIRCEAYENMYLRGRSGAGAVNSVGQDLLRHEAIHSMQEGGFLPPQGFGLFVAAYIYESVQSKIRTGDWAKNNAFEINAGLERGGYQRFDDIQKLCSWASERAGY
ncbi:fibronectin type III domain-containing protein [Lentzea aerocolonigenes]|uniref:fibronectin type III domain-containing protein n=1 Tax=Lentzea aerocolonigenes TaxID=68170 RepID=UPI00069686E9|nr:fibronectin type III domain-containing protein [Lentzea aerocolonigenes]